MEACYSSTLKYSNVTRLGQNEKRDHFYLRLYTNTTIATRIPMTIKTQKVASRAFSHPFQDGPPGAVVVSGVLVPSVKSIKPYDEDCTME